MPSVWEVRNGGDDTNGGGFDSSLGGTDYTLQTSPQATGTVTSAGTTVTATTGIFTSAMVGNYITNGTTWVKITAFTSSTVVTVASAPSWTAQSVKVGGALASPGQAYAIRAIADDVFLKYNASPFVITTGTVNASGGTIKLTADTTSGWLVGYDTTRTTTNTDANRPTLQIASSGVTSVPIITADAYAVNNLARNLILDGNSKAGIDGGAPNQNAIVIFENCKAINCETGFNAATYTAGIYFKNCAAVACSTQGFYYGHCLGCVADGCAAGFSGSTCNYCLAIGSTSSYGFGGGAYGYGGCLPTNCVAYGNALDGFLFAQYSGGIPACNCIAYGNGRYGFKSVDGCILSHCAAGNNTSGNTNGAVEYITSLLSLAGDPFTNAAGKDFALNPSGGDYASLKASAFPGVFPGGTTTGYLDIGAVQHQDSGGGGSAGARLVGPSALVTPGVAA